MKKEIIIAILSVVVLVLGAVYFFSGEKEEPTVKDNQLPEETMIEDEEESAEEKISLEFTQCLAQAGIVVYGSKTCSACARLVQEYGGYETIAPIYVECTEQMQRCSEEMLSVYVPEIQINGRLFETWGSPTTMAQITGCKL